MLQRRSTPHGPVLYLSPVLESANIPHAFSTRIGGVSSAPFDSLNLGNPNGAEIQDPAENIAINYQRLLAAISVSTDFPLRVHQVHGAAVELVAPNEPFDVSCKADAIVSRDPQRVISIRTADCVPILLASKDGKTVAAVHAGWRGIVAGVIPAAISRMNLPGENLLAAIGPCIGYDAFEVGPDVLEQMTALLGPSAPVKKMPGGKGRADLRESARLQLRAAGLIDRNIDSTDRCSFQHKSEFFSHRRDQGLTGRMAAVIATSPSL